MIQNLLLRALLLIGICFDLLEVEAVDIWTGKEGDYLDRKDLVDLEILQNGEPNADKQPYPWGNSFHYPFFNNQKGILSDQWVPMTYREAHKYYNAYETCSVMVANPEHCNGHQFKHNAIGRCQIDGRGELFPQDTVCPNIKGSFIRHITTKPWPENKYIVDVMAKMKEYGSNLLVFIGDSVTGNTYADTYCALSRVGMKFSHAGLEYLVVTDPNNNSSDPDFNPYVETTRHLYFVMRYFRYDGMHHSFDELREKLEKLIAVHSNGPITFLVNIGLHFNTPGDNYPDRLKEFLSYFIGISKKQQSIVIFRETTAQHFQTKSRSFSGEGYGYDDYAFDLTEDELVDNQVYFSALMNPKNRRYQNDSRQRVPVNRPDIHFCAPLRTKEELHANNWRNQILYQVLKEIDSQKEYVHVAKFHEITAGRHDLHALGDDCTHYCATPIIYYPLWQNIFNIVEKEFAKRKQRINRIGISQGDEKEKL